MEEGVVFRIKTVKLLEFFFIANDDKESNCKNYKQSYSYRFIDKDVTELEPQMLNHLLPKKKKDL